MSQRYVVAPNDLCQSLTFGFSPSLLHHLPLVSHLVRSHRRRIWPLSDEESNHPFALSVDR